MRQIPTDRGDCGVDKSVNTKQEADDRKALRVAPETKPLLPPPRGMACLSDPTSDRYLIRLFYSSRHHNLDPSANDVHFEHYFFIDTFLSIDNPMGITSLMVPH